MPQCCVVPFCSNKKSGHRFPSKPELRKAWLVAIKRDKFTPSIHSRVCNDHFDPEPDFFIPPHSILQNPKPRLKPDAVPSIFSLRPTSSLSAGNRSRRAQRRRLQKETQGPADGGNESEPQDFQVLDEPSPDSISNEENRGFDIDIVETEQIIDDMVINNDINPSDESSSEKSDDCEAPTCEPSACKGHVFRIENYRDAKMSKELQFYTGFENYEHFMFAFSLLGPQDNHLIYYSQCSTTSPTSKVLSPADEFFLTVMKLRRNSLNKELAFRFGIPQASVSILFITWINFLFCQFKELDIWASCPTLSDYMRFKGQDCESAIIIDCIEVKTDKPKNPTSQQQTYSPYKCCNTLKVLVGIAPTGAVTFVSDAYGGSISDRSLFEKSGLIQQLEENCTILADRGFQIQDLVSSKNVRVNIPDFVPQAKGQLEPHQLKRSKRVSAKRIHVERLIGLAKTYTILDGLSNNLVPLCGRIIFVCFMLANLRPNNVT